ncbi:hypothetical protein CPB84DRAFT_1822391 [Gymnopilus junonius]|uniref:Uncharacterized protein n=1 Tax=Gymnopilus junonius TaxID=109634 RepID=A0A9P5TSD4_GYMJU|nr:hypothetical protein CPB84DRAFT_1822391 [Gymnopilus junonius]
MTKAVPAVTEPVQIPVAPGVVLLATIDPLAHRHQIVCDLCDKTVRLTKTGHPDNFYRHRDKCTGKGDKLPKGLQIKVHEVALASSTGPTLSASTKFSKPLSKTPQVSQIITSFSHLQTDSPSQSPGPSLTSFSIPKIHRPKLHKCPGVEVAWSAGSIWATYAYRQHEGDSVRWKPIGFNSQESTIRLRDDECLEELTLCDQSAIG